MDDNLGASGGSNINLIVTEASRFRGQRLPECFWREGRRLDAIRNGIEASLSLAFPTMWNRAVVI